MTQPLGFVDLTFPSHVCRLQKIFVWFETRAPGMVQPVKWVFDLHWLSGIEGWYFSLYSLLQWCYILFTCACWWYLLTGSNPTLLQQLITLLSSEFKLRDLGSSHFFLGIEVKSTSMGLLVSQHKYTLDIIQWAGMTYCKPIATPLSTSSKLSVVSGTLHSDPTRYR
jgi:hypothetical protein